MHNPVPAVTLPVLGGAGLPPGSEPDPSGAVTAGPPTGGRPGPGAATRSPRERWEAAVAARPLEAPRALPSALQAMAAAISGRARAPLFTTGPATRHALAAAGALGATTGTVVHLPDVPADRPVMPHVLAHELTHTRSPVRRPRFLLDGVSGLLDDDERQALDAGRQALGAGRQALGAGRQAVDTAQQAGAGLVDRLPVGGGIGAVGDVAQRAARAAVLEATAGPLGNALGSARDMAGDAVTGAAGAVTGAAGAMSGAVTGAAGDAAEAVTGTAGAVGGAAAGAAGAVTGAAGAAAKQAIDPDRIVEVIEQRLLREIERRGGRWAGVF